MSRYLAQLLRGPVDRNGNIARVIAIYSDTGRVVGAVSTHQHSPSDDMAAVLEYVAAAEGWAVDEVTAPTTLPNIDVSASTIREWLRAGEHHDARLPWVTLYPLDPAGSLRHREGYRLCAYHSTRARAARWARECASLNLDVERNPLAVQR